MSTNIETLENTLGYTFKDKQLIIEALTHKSYKQPYDNERLEFLGDAVLDLIVSPDWDGRYYSFNSKWSENEQMGSMRNGCGAQRGGCPSGWSIRSQRTAGGAGPSRP